jgi:glycosyltransferase involved in cell wall biosynthesis
LNPEIFFSYIIPTIGRKSLKTAVQSVLSQEFSQVDFEVIVVNDSGKPLPNAEWQNSPRVRIITTNRSERSFARNSGAATARGKYLAFLDDDDWILPGALESFWNLANAYPNAAWLYGGIRVVDERDTILAEINSGLSGNCFAQIMGGAWAPIQASIMRASAFFEIGGFNPLICGTEDEDLCRRTAYHGEFANTQEIVACLFRGQSWDTSTNYRRAPEDVKYSRDLILARSGTFRRLMTSADSNFWYGRILRIYLSTISWNVKRKRYFTALSRLMHSLLAGFLSVHRFGSRDYQAGLLAHHAPNTLHFVMKQHNPTIRPVD